MYKNMKLVYLVVLELVNFFKLRRETKNSQNPIRFSMWIFQRIFGFNRFVYWPVHFTSVIANYKNVYAGIDTSPGFSPGCYIQGIGKVYIGDYTQIAANVGIISSNHNIENTQEHIVSEVKIGKYSWIGMNSVILPDVILGDFTIVGAGSIVTKSFSEGYCVIAGNPAKIIKRLNKNDCKRFKNEYEYNGYVCHDKFNRYRKEYLDI
mgnify:CR=1 FL=1